jgi:hypothetical protein
MGWNPTILRQARTFAFALIPPLPRERFRFYGARGETMRLRRGNPTMGRPMPKQDDLSRCRVALEHCESASNYAHPAER